MKGEQEKHDANLVRLREECEALDLEQKRFAGASKKRGLEADEAEGSRKSRRLMARE